MRVRTGWRLPAPRRPQAALPGREAPSGQAAPHRAAASILARAEAARARMAGSSAATCASARIGITAARGRVATRAHGPSGPWRSARRATARSTACPGTTSSPGRACNSEREAPRRQVEPREQAAHRRARTLAHSLQSGGGPCAPPGATSFACPGTLGSGRGAATLAEASLAEAVRLVLAVRFQPALPTALPETGDSATRRARANGAGPTSWTASAATTICLQNTPAKRPCGMAPAEHATSAATHSITAPMTAPARPRVSSTSCNPGT